MAHEIAEAILEKAIELNKKDVIDTMYNNHYYIGLELVSMNEHGENQTYHFGCFDNIYKVENGFYKPVPCFQTMTKVLKFDIDDKQLLSILSRNFKNMNIDLTNVRHKFFRLCISKASYIKKKNGVYQFKHWNELDVFNYCVDDNITYMFKDALVYISNISDLNL